MYEGDTETLKFKLEMHFKKNILELKLAMHEYLKLIKGLVEED